MLGYQDGWLLLLSGFYEARSSVPHNNRDKQPFSLCFTPDGEHVECMNCRAERWEPLTTEML